MDQSEILRKKNALIEIAARAFRSGLQTNSGGNLSVRLESAEACVIKPSGVGFAECTVDNLMVASLKGEILEGKLKPSKDMDFHLAIYRARPEVGAIVHVHSPWATGWASAGKEIPCLTVHSKSKLKRIPLVPLAPGGGAQTAKETLEVFNDPKVIAAIFADHGSVGVGRTLMSALYIAELIEETAHIAAVRKMIDPKFAA